MDGGSSALLLGEGNFSFALALSTLLSRKDECERTRALRYLGVARPPDRLYATSFDSFSEVHRKYPEAHGIIERLHRAQEVPVQVLHGINAWAIDAHFPGARFDLIAWNHPHLGKEDFRLHRFLMAHFFYSAAEALTPGGLVCVSLVDGQAERWEVVQQAQRHHLMLECVDPFEDSDYPGYQCKRNKTGQSFKNLHTKQHVGSEMRSFTYRFRHESAAQDRPQQSKVAAAPSSSTNGMPPDAPLDQEATTGRVPGDDKWGERVASNGQRALSSPAAESDFICPHCKKEFRSLRGLRTHVRQVHELKKYGDGWRPHRPRILQCAACDRAFADLEARWQHAVAKHTYQGADEANEPSQSTRTLDAPSFDSYYPCPICGLAVPGEWGIHQHLESLKPIVGLVAECVLCHRQFIEYRALQQHRNFCKAKQEGNKGIIA
ncbi:unnamed protein product [Vitrella brassicaformis CCMP3155]|uniref:C2H2-type domain-containing protein n=1 Tax=Vitrella brassicaformis (strain CCMP3155) TaxID=1169540 RepID=A0A0G4H5R9_VITBC|nr:unnamed protein product [Vitrella brassicaformis CCMP3155]|mmetsp:Transcript_10522/g.25521  ORF Transcript_10522/g.25521 Transcript_10522/m.25521 type:complete len:434 (-) Transcript_10522:210-1511(-)|eukprot:CEM39019.1 unnamed protein product [Vitrella brassicaformis CCMP3155]